MSNQERKIYLQDEEKSFEPQESEAVQSKKSLSELKRELKEFKKQAMALEFNPLCSRENYPGNYDNYIKTALTHISQLRKVRFDYALSNKKLYEGVPDFTNELKPDKKILLIDLDETLIHSDFSLEYLNDKKVKYDTIIKFKETESDFEENYEDYYDMRRKKLKH